MGVPLNADALSSARCLGERGFALLSQHWQTLQDVTASPGRIGLIARVARVALVFGAIRAPDAHVRVAEKPQCIGVYRRRPVSMSTAALGLPISR